MSWLTSGAYDDIIAWIVSKEMESFHSLSGLIVKISTNTKKWNRIKLLNYSNLKVWGVKMP